MSTAPALPVPLTAVRWAELRPDDFRARRAACPVVYLPIALCEPHGHIAALGLDLLKAEYFCEEAARRFGGIVAPSQGYHIHECGFHAPWLEEVVGEEDPLMAAIPPHVMVTLFLYQLRAFANAGFKCVVAVSGHSGGSQDDLRRAAALFSEHTSVRVLVQTDAEWAAGHFEGDHAGRFEISQLLAIRPDLVELRLLSRQHEPDSAGRLAVGLDADEATAEHGHAINEAIIAEVGASVATLLASTEAANLDARSRPLVSYDDIERLRRALPPGLAGWRSSQPAPGQQVVSATSRWKPYERLT